MAVPRPLLLVLVGTFLLAATLVAAQGAQKTAGVPAPAASAAHAPAGAGTPAKPLKAKPVKPAPAAVPGLPLRVERALKQKKVVVLFFRQRHGADDAATASAVAAIRGRHGVAVFSDGIRHLARYRRVVTSLGITQAPAVVIVDRKGKAQLVEGFVDEGTLTQQVVDAR